MQKKTNRTRVRYKVITATIIIQAVSGIWSFRAPTRNPDNIQGVK